MADKRAMIPRQSYERGAATTAVSWSRGRPLAAGIPDAWYRVPREPSAGKRAEAASRWAWRGPQVASTVSCS